MGREAGVVWRKRRSMSQAALSAKACRGDLYVFSKLVLPHQGMMFNVAYRLLGDREVAGEVVHEAMVLAYKEVCRRPEGSLKNRLLEIVVRRCYAQLAPRRHRVRPRDDRRSQAGAKSPAERANGCQPDQALQQTILSLPPEQRVILVLSDVQRLSYQEIADVLHVPRARVEAQLSQARTRLRDALQSSPQDTTADRVFSRV